MRSRFDEQLAQLEREPSGTVRVGLNFWRSSLVLPRVLPAFQRRYPHIQVEPAEGSHQDLSVLLDQGKLDFALLHRPNPYPQFAFHHLRHERILLFLRRDAPVLERLSPAEGDRGLPHLSWPELSALQDTPFLLLKKGQNLREQAEYIFQSAGIQPPAALTTLSLTTALGLAAEGCGAVLASEAVLDGDFLPPSLLPFTVGDPPVRWEVGFAIRAGVPLSAPAQLLVQAIQEAFGDGPAQAGAPSAPL